MDELNGLKALDSVGLCHVGWVKDVMCQAVGDNILITGRVRHSQRMNDTPLRPWIIASHSGYVHSAHCDCMAGLGKVCSHVGALLFWIDTSYRANKEMNQLTVNQKKAYWSIPAYVDKAAYAEIKDIDFSSAESKKNEFESAVSGEQFQKRNTLKLPEVPEPSAAEIQRLRQKLSGSVSKPAVLVVSVHFQDEYIPEVLKEGKLPISLSSLRDDKFFKMEREELLTECQQLFANLTVTEEQARTAESVTKEQRKCKEWHFLRQGRFTASNMKAVCQGFSTKPARSTVKAICGQSRFKTNAMQWGIDKEEEAFELYCTTEAISHESMVTDFCDFVVWTEKECSIQRILPDQSKFEEIIQKSRVYFTEVILPEK